MQIYKVGGAVRDALLGLEVKDNDWVVVGANPETLMAQGFVPVGNNFPVFLHPTTKEEYALARTERKSGHGYGGFIFYANPDVTLEEDLRRRDLTINAIAEDDHGHLIDPYGGQQDLQQQLLRHVSSAFSEDPLRVLRVARFAAKLKPLGFTIAEETLQLMQAMVQSGELSHLTRERVWQETLKSLEMPSPEVYFSVLKQCGADAVMFAAIAHFFTDDALQALERAAAQQQPAIIRFARLFSLGEAQADLAKQLNQLGVPVLFNELATLAANHHAALNDALVAPSSEGWMSLFEGTDAFRRFDRFVNFLRACDVEAKTLLDGFAVCEAVKASDVVATGVTGKAVGETLRQWRVEALEELLASCSS